jgi:hypothetical protein
MGNTCECFRRQGGDEAEDALLASLMAEGTAEGRPRGPPPPYQVSLVCVHCMKDGEITELRRRQRSFTVFVLPLRTSCFPPRIKNVV